MSGDQSARYQALINRYLSFYESLHFKRMHAKTAAQRQFQDVAWEACAPETEHERAYVWYLESRGRLLRQRPPPPLLEDDGWDAGVRPISAEVARKWDEQWVDTRGSRPDWD